MTGDGGKVFVSFLYPFLVTEFHHCASRLTEAHHVFLYDII